MPNQRERQFAVEQHRWRDRKTGRLRSAMWAWLLPWTVTQVEDEWR